MPNKTTLRSVLVHDNLVYTGSYEDFGYWKKDKKGVLQYTSLTTSIRESITINDEIWQIVPYKETIVFRSFSSLYIYHNDGSIKKLTPPSVIMSCNIVNDEFYLSTLQHGIYKIENEELQPYFFHELLVDAKVIAVSSYNDKLLVSTSLKGSYFIEKDKLIGTNFTVNKAIIAHQLNSFSTLNDGRMVFGTIKDGIYITDKHGTVLSHLNKENGLSNNTVLAMHVEPDNKVWLGLDNGISFVDLSSHNYFFNDISGRLGAVYDVVKFKDTLYIGSNTGLFYLDSNNALQFVEGSQGQVWDLEIIEGQLFCGHNNGTYIVEGFTLKEISPFTGGLTIKKVPEKSNLYIQGAYTGLIRFSKNDLNWNAKHLGGTSMLARYLVFEDRNQVWVSHAYKGLHKVTLGSNYDTITSVKSYKDKGIWSNFNVSVHQIKKDICFKSNNGWQKYEPLQDTIIPFDLLNNKLGKDSYIISDFDTDLLVVKTKNETIEFISLTNLDKVLILNNQYFKDRLVVGYERVSYVGDSLYALSLMDGFMLIDGKEYHEHSSLQLPLLEQIEINDELIDLGILKNQTIDLDYGKSISFSLTSATSENYYLEYALEADGEPYKWYKMKGDKLKLANLSSGGYKLQFRAVNDFGEASEVFAIQLNVLYPWYRDTPGLLLFFVLAGIIALVFFVLHKRKIAKEQRLLSMKYTKEQEELLLQQTLESDRKLVELKNESLRNEVKLKSKQLANTAMALVKKNETLLEIKNELTKHKDEFTNYFSYKRLIKKVDNSIDHKDEWEVFEFNFNQVHEEFFNKLKERHPDLTHKDLKVCAYIKMNLSTKEIAPLMNISIRGVETNRYRLRKKLDLENDNSLVDYLQNI